MGSQPSPPRTSPRRRLLLAALAAAALLGVVVALIVVLTGDSGPDFRGTPPPARLIAAPFELQDQTGAVVRGDELRGRVVLLTFLSTNCRAECPPTASTIRVAMDELSDEERAEVVALAISIDPEFDSAETATEFVRARRLDGLMQYLVGSLEELEPVWEDYAVLSSVDTGSSDNHSVPVRIFDRDGVWVVSLRSNDDLTAENLAHDLREVLAN